MSSGTRAVLAWRPITFVLVAALMAAAIALPARVLAHTPAEGHPTSTTVACDEHELLHGSSTECIVTVTDLTDDPAEAAAPAGSVTLTSNQDEDLGSCDLVASTATQSTCAVADVTGSPGTHALTATYAPEATDLHTFAASSGTATLVIVGGTIVIQKETLGTTGTFNFTLTEGDTDTSFSLQTTTTGSTGVASQAFTDLVPGTFTVVESATAGWSLSDLGCSIQADGTPGSGAVASVANRSAVISVVAGEAVTCRFENSRHGEINIVKATGDEDGTFAFTTTGGLSGGGFTITTADGTGSLALTDVAPGTYVVTEAEAEGWALAGIECTASTGSSTSVAGTAATIELAASGTVTCTFTNEAVEEDEPVVGACGGPAAPAIAAAYLKSEGIKPGGPGRVNLVAAVARQLGGARATFDGLTKCDEGYAAAVEAFLAAEIEAQGLGATAESGLESRAEGQRGGPPPWAQRGRR